jgi:hypothetical protein
MYHGANHIRQGSGNVVHGQVERRHLIARAYYAIPDAIGLIGQPRSVELPRLIVQCVGNRDKIGTCRRVISPVPVE